MQIWRERLEIFFSHPRCAGQHSQLISSLPTQNAHAGRKPSLFRRSILIYLNQEWAMKKNYDNKNIFKYKYEMKANTFLLYNQPLYWSWTCLWIKVNRYLSYKSTANWFAQNARTTTVAIAAACPTSQKPKINLKELGFFFSNKETDQQICAKWQNKPFQVEICH